MSFVQYVILRKDLQTTLGWPLGALIAQACHAATAVLHIYQEDENTRAYLAKLDSMHKVVLQIPDAESLNELASTLTTNNIDFKLWIEQPENIPTCIAIKPYPRDVVKPLVKQFKLYS
ncbi:unnamed protein product [Allacma fusca]|uniref:Aminoacyl-tRNA hydrolase n=1 Tax=Allacma fusca TaxID=39272 RepID=A0A8J2PC96_9HEXA|nr:unnamed protein product [Allacma fusca]